MRLRLAVTILTAMILCISASLAEAAFENVELGARPLGMGSAFAASADGAGSMFWNPAGMAQVDHRELTTSYMELYDLVSYSSIAYAHHINRGSIGIGLISSSDVDAIYRENVIAFSRALEIYRGLSAGVNVKYLSSAANTGDIRVGSGRGLSMDLGCQYHAFEDLVSFGVASQNLVGYISYKRESVADIPGQEYSQSPDLSYRVGANIKLGGLLTDNAEDAILAAGFSDGDFHAGGEITFWDVISLRAGYKTGNALTRSITAGFGLKFSALKIDYAYIGSEVGCETSQFSVSVNW